MTFLDVAPKLTERAFAAQVVKAAEFLGWRVYRTWNSQHSPAGFPDLVLLRARHDHPRIIFAELKSDRGKLTDEQRAWIDELRACGQEAYVWRPSTWDHVEKRLR